MSLVDSNAVMSSIKGSNTEESNKEKKGYRTHQSTSQADFLLKIAPLNFAQSLENLQSNHALQASALIGRKVLIKNNILKLGAENSLKIFIKTGSEYSNIAASIYSISGKLIKIIPIEQITQNEMLEFFWDGTDQYHRRVHSSVYTVTVSGIYQDQMVNISTMSYANVDSVSLGQNGEGLKLNLEGLGPVSLNVVEQILM